MPDPQDRFAPGWPGIPPRWTSSAKTGVGTALNLHSQVWFTLSHGILNEVYFPRVDNACTRDQGLLVTDGKEFFSEEKRHTTFRVSQLSPGVPAYQLTNTCVQGRYRIVKDVVTDPYRNVVLQKIQFEALQGKFADYRLYALLSPHLGNCGYGNNGWAGDYKGVPMLFAERDGYALAFACSIPWTKLSAGFVGYSDGWQDISKNFQMTWEYAQAHNGNIALTGEIDLQASGGQFLLAIGFGGIWSEAGQQALSSILDGFDCAQAEYLRHWKNWQSRLIALDSQPRDRDLYRTSTAVLRTHESKSLLGGIIASLSIPWGFNKGDEDLGGYHLVWPRDLVETAGGLLAAGAVDDAFRVLRYLEVTQENDGHWAQNLWLDGRPYWGGLQLDETAFPVLLLDMLRREAPVSLGDLTRWWPMVKRAAGFIMRNGPVTQQDRWEEDAGYSPFTLAVEIAALLAAADLADLVGEPDAATYLRETGDNWNDNVERWVYAVDADLCRQLGVEGYYVRISPPDTDGAASPVQGFVPIKNRPAGSSDAPASHVVSPDCLALVRFGLRAPDDPRILNTIKVVDAVLRVKLPQGPCWYRYNEDGYGEHEDGSPFDGTGIGRPWPLLAGERAHYELAAGRKDTAEALLRVLEYSTDESGLIPEQVWDQEDIPAPELVKGKSTGSARPLVWAHAEYIKLRRSLRDGKIFDQPPQPVQRYQVEKKTGEFFGWRFNNKTRTMPCGKKLRIILLSPGMVHWSDDNWQTTHDTYSRDTGLGVHPVDLPTNDLPAGREVVFTFYWPDQQRWEGINYSIAVE
ncbi:MAG TPA: glucan 1,4-alpha-glucosidase [Terriglobales bacterium]|nr:glucan 1,4-alpha-glucosidase [Terriglobales bacterium]